MGRMSLWPPLPYPPFLSSRLVEKFRSLCGIKCFSAFFIAVDNNGRYRVIYMYIYLVFRLTFKREWNENLSSPLRGQR